LKELQEWALVKDRNKKYAGAGYDGSKDYDWEGNFTGEGLRELLQGKFNEWEKRKNKFKLLY